MCKEIQDPTFEQLRVRYQTWRPFVISSTGRNRKYGYRHGCQTALGDLEESYWLELIHQLICRSGEEALQAALLAWATDHCPWLDTRKEREMYALELHAARIFENRNWVGYEEFNQHYRPPLEGGANT